MRNRLVSPAIAAGLFILAGCDIDDMGGAFERHTEDFHFNYPMKSGGRLSVDGFNGSIVKPFQAKDMRADDRSADDKTDERR